MLNSGPMFVRCSSSCSEVSEMLAKAYWIGKDRVREGRRRTGFGSGYAIEGLGMMERAVEGRRTKGIGTAVSVKTIRNHGYADTKFGPYRALNNKDQTTNLIDGSNTGQERTHDYTPKSQG